MKDPIEEIEKLLKPLAERVVATNGEDQEANSNFRKVQAEWLSFIRTNPERFSKLGEHNTKC